MTKSNREMGATVVWGGSREGLIYDRASHDHQGPRCPVETCPHNGPCTTTLVYGSGPEPLGRMAGMLLSGECKASANPEPAAGQVWQWTGEPCSDPHLRDPVAIMRVDLDDGLAYFADDTCANLRHLREVSAWRCIGIETPAGRVMVGERRRHPDGSAWRVVGIERDTFPGCSSTVVRAYDERETGRGGTYGPALVASWPLLSGPLAEAAKDAIRSPPTGIESARPSARANAIVEGWLAQPPHPIAVLLAPLVYGEPGVSRSLAAEIDADLEEAVNEPLVLSGGRWYEFVEADPYAAGREREQAIMLAAEAHQETARLAHARTDRNWTPKPSARTLALRSLGGEQMVRGVYDWERNAAVLRAKGWRVRATDYPERRDRETLRVLACVAAGQDAGGMRERSIDATGPR